MRNLLLLLLLLVIPIPIVAAERIEVIRESFNPNETTALVYKDSRIDKGKDLNGNDCALVIVEGVDNESYLFETVNTFCRAEKRVINKESIIFILVSDGTKRIKIKHSDRVIEPLEYIFENGPLQANCTYHIYLNKLSHSAKGGKQILNVSVSPTNAMLKLEETPSNYVLWTLDHEGYASKLLKMGKYNYQVSARDYYPEYGFVEINGDYKPCTLRIQLKPKFGFLSLDNSFCEDAIVFIDDERINLDTNKIIKLPSGRHDLTISRRLYQDYTHSFIIKDGETTSITPSLSANYSEVSLLCSLNDVKAYIKEGENESLITNMRDLKLSPGSYLIIARKPGYKDSETLVRIEWPNQKYSFDLNPPVPQYGSLLVTSNIKDSDVYIDGCYYGKTPFFINNLLAKTHFVKVLAKDYIPDQKTVVITTDTEQHIDFKLSNLFEVTCNVLNGNNLKCYNGNTLLQGPPYFIKYGDKITLYAFGKYGYRDIVKSYTIKHDRHINLKCPQKTNLFDFSVVFQGAYNFNLTHGATFATDFFLKHFYLRVVEINWTRLPRYYSAWGIPAPYYNQFSYGFKFGGNMKLGDSYVISSSVGVRWLEVDWHDYGLAVAPIGIRIDYLPIPKWSLFTNIEYQISSQRELQKRIFSPFAVQAGIGYFLNF